MRSTYQSALFSRMLSIATLSVAVPGYISCIVSLPPLVLQIRQRNFPCSVLIISIVTLNIIYATNALIWGSADSASWWDGRIFCDIEIRLHVALQVTIPGAAACIFRQLSLVFHPSLCLPTKAQKRRTRFIEITLCIVIPVLRMIAVYVVQPERYWIIRINGCHLSTDTSWPSYVLVYLWTPLLSVIGLVYAAITTIRLVYHRRNTRSIRGQGQNRRNESRVIRLYCLGVILFVTFVLLQAYGVYFDLPRHLRPYSWSRIHPANWSERIVVLPPSGTYLRDIFARWITMFYSISIAILTGLSPDAAESYKGWLAQFHPWWRCLNNRKSTLILPSNHLSIQHESGIQLQAMGRYELDDLSVNRQDQGAV